MEGLRPLGVGELLDAAIKIYRGRARTLIAAVAVPVVPVIVLSGLVTWSASTDLTVDPVTGQADFGGDDLALFGAGMLVTLLATLLATAVATAACYRSISGAYVGDDPTWQESLRFGWSRVWSVIGLTILTSLAAVLGLLACIVGVVVPLTFFAVAMPVLLVEGLGAGAAMRRSWQLVKGTGWRVLGIVLLSLILSAAFQAVLSSPVALILVVDMTPLVEQLVNLAAQTLSTVLVTPFTAALTMALYVDLRVRKEGFDLVLWSQRLGAQATDGFPAQPGSGSGSPTSWVPGAAPPPPPPPPPPGAVPPPPPPPPPPGGAEPARPPAGWAPPPGHDRR